MLEYRSCQTAIEPAHFYAQSEENIADICKFDHLVVRLSSDLSCLIVTDVGCAVL